MGKVELETALLVVGTDSHEGFKRKMRVEVTCQGLGWNSVIECGLRVPSQHHKTTSLPDILLRYY
jgi:hypothetical protein